MDCHDFLQSLAMTNPPCHCEEDRTKQSSQKKIATALRGFAMTTRDKGDRF
ncbi:hypothetical protein [Helicobacter fennelliae]